MHRNQKEKIKMANTTKKTSTKKTNSELALEAHEAQTKKVNSIEKSAIANLMGKTTDFVIEEGTEKEYTITLQYPGASRAMEIEDVATNRYGNISFTPLMEEAIKDVIVVPKVTSLDFWNTHAGLNDVALAVLSFLNAGIQGKL